MAAELTAAAAAAAIRAQTKTQIGLSLLCFNGEKPYTITPEQWIQRVDNARQAGAWTAAQTMGFITSAITGDALKWYKSLKTRGIDQNNWDERLFLGDLNLLISANCELFKIFFQIFC